MARIVHKEGAPWSFKRDLNEFSNFIATNNIALAVLDPIDHIIDGISTHAGRDSLDRLDQLAKTAGCAIVIVGHVNKGQHRDIRSALGGSRRLLGVSRSTWVWGDEPLGGAARGPVEFKDLVAEPLNPCSVLCCVKNSFGRKWPPVLYENLSAPNPFDPKHTLLVQRPLELAGDSVLPYTKLSVVNNSVTHGQERWWGCGALGRGVRVGERREASVSGLRGQVIGRRRGRRVPEDESPRLLLRA